MADTGARPEIKVDPAAPTTEMKDITAFEDDPTLEIPSGDNNPQAWLVRLPEYLWKAWADMYRSYADDTPIEIGKMRVRKQRPDAVDDDPNKRDIEIRLAPRVPQHRNLPPSYEVKLRSQGYNGHVVFSERESVEEARKRSQQQRMGGGGRGIPSKAERYGKFKKGDGNNNGKGQLRSTIHRNTALAPQIHHVADAIPVGDVYEKYLKKQVATADIHKNQTRISDKIDKSLTSGGSNFGPFSSFTTTSRPSAKNKAAAKEKAVRMPQAELLDALGKCFRQYKYWGLKALRAELHQPEAYIKQTLEQIAVLVRSGDFAMNYKLRPEFAAQSGIKDEDVKQEHKDVGSDVELEGPSGTGSEDEDEDEDGFEDVQMEG